MRRFGGGVVYAVKGNARAGEYARCLERKIALEHGDPVGQTEGHQPFDRVTSNLD
jgi:hypothetical protein